MDRFITGDKFITLADCTFAPESKPGDNGLQNTYNPHSIKDGDIIYTHSDYAHKLLDAVGKLDKRVTLITHNGDVNIDDSFIVPDNVIKWYAQNVNVANPKIESIPIGLENDRWFANIRKKEKIDNITTRELEPKNWVYLNVNARTNPSKREFLYDLFKDKEWVTCERGENGSCFDSYIENVYTHHYTLCPEGNGMDTHRVWESLYVGRIPLMQKNLNNVYYEKILPILLVDKWEDITQPLLYNNLWQLQHRYFECLPVLSFEYWKNKIRCGKTI